MRTGRLILGLVLAATALGPPAFARRVPPAPGTADPLRAGFETPPPSARPRVWWHWMNGNISKDGIAKDLAWMKRVGIGGVQNFDANLTTPQVVDHRLVYMTPEWKDAFRYAAGLADRLGLEFAIASSPGWSETGGPWVAPAEGLKKLVWSETVVDGGQRFTGRLPAPRSVTGPFQSLPMAPSIEEMLGAGGKAPPTPRFYADVAVLAYPVGEDAPAPAAAVSVAGKAVDAAALTDDDLTSGVDVPPGVAGAPGVLAIDYPAPRTVRSATLFVPGAKSMFTGAAVTPRLEVVDAAGRWHTLAEIALTETPTTVGFAPVTARRFRLVLAPSNETRFPLGDPAPGADPGPFAAMAAAGVGRPVHIAELRLSGEAKVDRFQAKAGFTIARDYYALGGVFPEAAGPPASSVSDLSDRMRSDGTLDWTPPPGRWRIVRIGASLLGTTNHPASPEATGLEVDKFDAAAVRAYLETYLGKYRDAAGPALIGAHGVRAMLTDSIEVGAANWTPRMVAQFRRLRGYDPTPWLPTLTGALIGTRAESDAFLYDYRRTLADLLASEHYGTVASVAHEHGLTLYGEALEDNRPSLGDDTAMRSHTDVPMAAMWTYARATGPNPSYVADIRGAASVAHVYGQNLVAAESMTSAMAPWAYAPADLRRVIDLEFAIGVNRPVIHTSVHQPVDDRLPGLSLFIFGQYFNRHDTWAEMARPWVDYMARTAFLLQHGRNVADVAYFYGEEAPLTGLYGQTPVGDAPARYGYDFIGPDALLHRLGVEGGALVAASGARYRLLYLGGSSARMTLPVLRRIAALAEAGATIVGGPPLGSPSLNDDAVAYAALKRRLWSGAGSTRVGLGRVIAGGDVESALAAIGAAPDFAYARPKPDSEWLFVHRKLADGEAYFVDNRQNRAEHGEARFRVTGKRPELWHADTGRSEWVSYRIEGGSTVVPLDLGAEESVFVIFRHPATAPAMQVAAPAPSTIATLGGAWRVSFQPGRGAPAGVTLPALGSLADHPDPGVRYFSGTATYTRDFDLPRAIAPGAALLLDLGRVGDVAQVRVNGRLVGTSWHAPYRLDIGAAVRPGHNSLDIRVADLWVNRLIGDAQPGARKITWTASATYKPTAPLRPAGLIGPVRLLTTR